MRAWLLSLLALSAAEILPVVFMHGVNSKAAAFDECMEIIRSLHPTATLHSLDLNSRTHSHKNLWKQGEEMHVALAELSAQPEYADGFSLVCHSQGALLCRSVIQRFGDSLPVKVFISLAGPQLGFYGLNGKLRKMFTEGVSKGLDKGVWKYFYTKPWQARESVANYWHDPRPGKKYLEKNTFLPVMMNDPGRTTQGPGLEKNDTEALRYKANLLRLERAVFTCSDSPDEDMVLPPESGIFEFYNDTKTKHVTPLEETPLWTEDWLGLRELHETGRFIRHNVPGVKHRMWHRDKDIVMQYIVPHLARSPSEGVSLLQTETSRVQEICDFSPGTTGGRCIRI